MNYSEGFFSFSFPNTQKCESQIAQTRFPFTNIKFISQICVANYNIKHFIQFALLIQRCFWYKNVKQKKKSWNFYFFSTRHQRNISTQRQKEQMRQSLCCELFIGLLVRNDEQQMTESWMNWKGKERLSELNVSNGMKWQTSRNLLLCLWIIEMRICVHSHTLRTCTNFALVSPYIQVNLKICHRFYVDNKMFFILMFCMRLNYTKNNCT